MVVKEWGSVEDSWYTNYSSTLYSTSVFFKGALLYNLVLSDEERVIANNNQQTFKTSLKSYSTYYYSINTARPKIGP